MVSAGDLLRGRDREEFVAGLAYHWGEINTIHSFREVNTRTQSVFFSQLAREAGYELDVGQFAENSPLRTEFVQARFYNQATARTDRLVGVLDKAITETHTRTKSRANASLIAVEHLTRRRLEHLRLEGEIEI